MTAWTHSREAIEHLEERVRRPRRTSLIAGACVVAAGLIARATLMPTVARDWSAQEQLAAASWTRVALLTIVAAAVAFGDFLRWRAGARCPACSSVLGCVPTWYPQLIVQRRFD